MIRSIAVLPLDNLAGDASQEYFADGMTDELITMLAKYKSLRVISCTSVMQYKKTRKSLPEIARELSVDGIVEGSISRSQEKLRVTAQLAYGPTDTHCGAESYSRELSDALLLQHDLAKDIAARVNAASGGAATSVRGPAGNTAARDAYFHGRYKWFSQHYPKSRELFQEAIRLDPAYAAAYSGLADSYTASVASGLESLAQVRPLAEAAARPDSPELSWFLIDAYGYKGDNEAAMRKVRIAVRQDSELAAQAERAYQSGGMPAVHAQFLSGMKEALVKGKYVSPTYMAEQAALAGRRVESLRYLQKAYEQRDAHLVYLEHNPTLDALRSEPAFAGIARKMRLPDAE
jgi:TolB-like protein